VESGSTATGSGFRQVRSVTDLQINPLRQRQRRQAILANAGSLAVSLKCLGKTVPVFRAPDVMSGMALARRPRLVAS
jgi:hypothetical protein